MDAALAEIGAAFDEAAAVNAFKLRVEQTWLRAARSTRRVRARFAARAASCCAAAASTPPSCLAERWWRDERKAFQIASAFGRGNRLSLDVLRELRLILRLMRWKRMQAEFRAIVAALDDDPISDGGGMKRRVPRLSPGRAWTTRMCSSRNCFAVASDGAPIIKSSARWFIGNSTTSRRFSSPHSSMTMRSMPGAMPPCGGAPSDSACSMPPNFCSSTLLVVAGDGERLLHHVGTVIADRAGGQLHAVADDVVLDRLDAEDLVAVGGVEREKFLGRAVRHRERVVGEVDLLLLLVPLVHRKIDDPAELEAILVDQTEFFADLGARRAGEFVKRLRLAGDEEHGVAVLQAELRAQRLGALGAEIVGDRTAADDQRRHPRRK